MVVDLIKGGWMAYCRWCKTQLTAVLITDEEAGLRRVPVCGKCHTPPRGGCARGSEGRRGDGGGARQTGALTYG